MDTLRTFNDTQSYPPGQACEISELLAVKAWLTRQLAEVDARLQGKKLPNSPSPLSSDKEALAIGLIVKFPDIPVTELALAVGVTRKTIYSPAWAQYVGSTLRARRRQKYARRASVHQRFEDNSEDD